MVNGTEGAIQELLGMNFFQYALPWLLTFAIVYGILEHYDLPHDASSRAVIAIVLAFFTLPVAGPLLTIISQLGASMVIIVTGLLVFIILLEIAGVRATEPRSIEEGEIEEVEHAVVGNIFQKHWKAFTIFVIVLAGWIFFSRGGLEFVGIEIPEVSAPTIFFLGFLGLLVIWMASESGGER